MRIAIISDSHRNKSIIKKILLSQPEAKDIFFLGDLTGDIDDIKLDFKNRNFYIVSGNCDYFSFYPSSSIETIAGKKIFYTHGHTLGVKHGTDSLIRTALNSGCDIALYGHTHSSQILYENGLYVVNPGSCQEPRNGDRSYAVIDIEPTGIMPIIINI